MKAAWGFIICMFATNCFGATASVNEKTPSYLDCSSNSVAVYPGGATVSWTELQQPSNAVVQLLGKVESNRTSEYVVVLVRPGSIKVFRRIRNVIDRQKIDAKYELTDADFQVKLTGGRILELEPAKEKSSPEAAAPGVPHTPLIRGVVTHKEGLFFECRNNQVFFIDKDGLDTQVSKLLSDFPASDRGTNIQQFLAAIRARALGTTYYAVDPRFLMVGQTALGPRPGLNGDEVGELDKPDSKFRKVIERFDRRDRFAVFLVRDDSFGAFRKARQIAEAAGFETSWELLELDEPIKFGR